jgi:ABC-2 type transport system permease protein/capsular polysaccharide transport system permease protein
MPSNERSVTTGALLRDSEWTVMRRVIGALLMRELLTRYGRNNIGFLWLFVEPMLFVIVVVIIRTMIRSAGFAVTVPVIAFALTGYASMLLWRNMPSRCIGAHKSNLSLLYHKPVTILDVYISRVILEMVAVSTSFVALGIGFYAMGWVPAPEDALQVLGGWLLLAWFGLGLGWTIGGLAEKAQVVGTLWSPFSYLLIVFSGTFFLADSLPPSVRQVALWIPILNGLEFVREGWFGSLFRAWYDIPYVIVCNLLLTFCGLSLVRQVGTDVSEE